MVADTPPVLIGKAAPVAYPACSANEYRVKNVKFIWRSMRGWW